MELARGWPKAAGESAKSGALNHAFGGLLLPGLCATWPAGTKQEKAIQIPGGTGGVLRGYC